MQPGTRVIVVTTEPDFIELYGMTGAVVDGPNAWGSYGVLLDPEHDPYQLTAAFDADELEEISA
ncbi:hypothetical protein ACFQ8S_06770 [Streptomyces virginiae]|uniref:hypothetical protein n=1 Tax=Streptomyces virginiae TaxID=1961 RepID=UPI0036BD3EEA